MKNMRWLVIFGLLAMVLAPMSALAEMETTVHGEARFRAENVQNYFDFEDDGFGDDSFSFAPFRIRLGMGVSFGDKVSGYVSLQEGDIFGQDSEVKGLNETVNSDGELIIYQGYIKMNEVGGSSLGLKFGRQEYTQGNEFLFGDLDFYNGISLDGVRARWDLGVGPLDVVWFRTDEDLFGDDDTDIIGANLLLTEVVPDGDLEFYLYNVDTDDDVDFITVGARAGQAGTDDSGFIWSAEVAFQSGDDGDDDISALGGEGMFGYNWVTDGGTHQFFGTLYYTSGDDDPFDDDTEDFIILFQDFHGRNGAADVFAGANLTTFSVGWDWQGEKHGVRAELLFFNATEAPEAVGVVFPCPCPQAFVIVGSDGSGLPGEFASIGLDGEDDLGNELDIIYTYQVNEYFGFEAGVALFQPGDAVEAAGFEDDDVTRLWGQARLRF